MILAWKARSVLHNIKGLKMSNWRLYCKNIPPKLVESLEITQSTISVWLKQFDQLKSKEILCRMSWSREMSKNYFSSRNCFLKDIKGKPFLHQNWSDVQKMKSGNTPRSKITMPSLVNPAHSCLHRWQKKKTSTVLHMVKPSGAAETKWNHICETLSTTTNVFEPSEQTKGLTRGLWNITSLVPSDCNGQKLSGKAGNGRSSHTHDLGVHHFG